jgi:twitching motility two-component system response regulator PilG
MVDRKNFSVAFMGLQEFDKRVLNSIFKLSLGRDRSYVETRLDPEHPSDIVLLNMANEAVVADYQAKFLDQESRPKIPTVLLSKEKPQTQYYYHIGLPLRAPLVLRTLDEVTIKELNFIPELTIGKENDTELSSTNILHKIADAHSVCRQSKLLVVDDSPTVRKQIEMQLKLLGYEADLVEDGETALEMVKREQYRIIFLDVVMPGIDGYKVCKAIKRLPQTRLTPVIMLTGKSSPFDRVRGTLAGCDSYLTKPVEHEAFEKAIKRYLSQPNKPETKMAEKKLG